MSVSALPANEMTFEDARAVVQAWHSRGERMSASNFDHLTQKLMDGYLAKSQHTSDARTKVRRAVSSAYATGMIKYVKGKQSGYIPTRPEDSQD